MGMADAGSGSRAFSLAYSFFTLALCTRSCFILITLRRQVPSGRFSGPTLNPVRGFLDLEEGVVSEGRLGAIVGWLYRCGTDNRECWI